ncbi:hypothetical protein PVAND_000296 [Polypedilum vanderplanki]|uniref:Uncharacterized protein n=1 Tax=Polypedilum vanderplanki TaxID=319348 RepID=A0A9J6BJF4_POLVA|nr:hypothetical protein PVAND_000296 [Polypedilum vanderplanki]
MILNKFLIFVHLFAIAKSQHENQEIPSILHGEWFSWEEDSIKIVLNENSLTNKTQKLNLFKLEKNGSDFSIIFQNNSDCFTCMKVFIRSYNIFESLQSPCINDKPIFENICKEIKNDQKLITHFKLDYIPLICRSSIQGVYQFSYQQNFRSNDECDNPESQIYACQRNFSIFLNEDTKFKSLSEDTSFTVNYSRCKGIEGTFDGIYYWNCLGDWKVGKNHYFAVANSRESRNYEKFRCFMRNLNDNFHLAVSNTAECNTLKTIENSPEILKIKPITEEFIEPYCKLPENFTGEFFNPAKIDSEVFINETHIIEKFGNNQIIHVCKEQQNTKFMMTRMTVNGCLKDFICFDFDSRNYNVIRYKKSLAILSQDFNEVCSSQQFSKNQFNFYFAKNPSFISCPISGNFEFTQKGDEIFKNRNFNESIENHSKLKICGEEHKEILISFGNISNFDYKFNCIDYWKENNKSYLITYNDFDPWSEFRCWVYQRTNDKHILMSQSTGAFCGINQNSNSQNYTEGAALALDLMEIEEENDKCPVKFNDGEIFK